jgi:hypothetical protein
MSNKRIPVWVNGECCDGLKAAAERVSLLSGQKVSAVYLSRQIKRYGTIVHKGVTVSGKAALEPKKLPDTSVTKEPEKEPPTTQGRRPLLRYPPGEAPIDRGICSVLIH